MRNMVRATFAALTVFTLALTAANTALAQQGDDGVRVDQGAEDVMMERQRLRSVDGRAEDFFEREMEAREQASALCSSEDALAGRCAVVARLPRCPGDPRCPDPTRAHPDTETHE